MSSLVANPGLAQPGALRPGYPGLPGLAPPVITVCGQGAWSVPWQSAQPPAAWHSLQVPVLNVQGHWMVAIVTWQQQEAGQGATVHVGDDTMRNYWQPLGQPAGTSAAAGVVRTAIWTAPAAYAAQYVLVAPTQTVQALACTVLDVSGMLPWQTLTTLSATYANASTTLSALTTAAPASTALIITGCGSDLNTATISLAGSGWTTLTPVSAANGHDHTADITLSAAYQVTTGTTSATWSSTGTEDMCGIIAGLLISGTPPVQASPHWPYTVAELAIGSGPSTPEDSRTWTPVTARTLQLQGVTQGSQYNLAALTSAAGTVTFDNPDGALIAPGTGSFAGIDSGTPFRVRQVWAASTVNPYGVPFAGYIRTWPQAWDPAMLRGVTTAAITDAWAYCNGNLQPILLQEILNDSPYAYWPCVDAAGSSQASNYAPGNTTPLVVTQSKYGTHSISQAFGQNSTALLGAQGTYLLTSSVRQQTQAGMWGQSGQSNSPDGWCLLAQDPDFPSLANGVTIEVWFQLTSPYPSNVNPQPILTIANTYGVLFQVFPDGSGSGDLYLSTATNQYSVGAAGVNYDTTSVLTHLAITCTSAGFTSYINGVQTRTATYATALPQTFSYLAVDGAFTPAVTLNPPNGYFGHIAVYGTQLTPERIMTHYQAGVLGMTGDSADARIERLLQAGSFPGRRVILQDSGSNVTPVASCQDIASQPAATSIANIAASTLPAVLAVAPTGDLTYLARGYVYNQPVRWVIGQNTANGEIPYLSDLATSYDPLRVVNDVQLTQLDNQDIVTPQPPVSTVDAASQQQYGDQSYWVTGYLENDLLSSYAAGPGLIDLANWIGNVNALPGNRIGAITVDAASNPAAWPLFMTAAKGDMVTVNIRPVTAPGVVLSVTGRISQTTRDMVWSLDSPPKATIQLLIDIAPEQAVLTADDPVRGQLSGQFPFGW